MEKINKLRKILNREKIDGYLIPKNNEFFGEYVQDYNDRLSYISNFEGSYGFCFNFKKRIIYLLTDDIHFRQNKQSGDFFKIITFPKKMPFNILKNKKYLIGFDPKLFTKKTLQIFFAKSNCKFKPLNKNLVDEIWKRKIPKNKNKFFILPE